MKIKILVVDDNLFYREGVVQVLGKDPLVEVAGEGASGQEAIDKAVLLKPKVILI